MFSVPCGPGDLLQRTRRLAYQVDAPVVMQTNTKSWIMLRRLRKPEFHIYLKTLNVVIKSQRMVMTWTLGLGMAHPTWWTTLEISQHVNTRSLVMHHVLFSMIATFNRYSGMLWNGLPTY